MHKELVEELHFGNYHFCCSYISGNYKRLHQDEEKHAEEKNFYNF